MGSTIIISLFLDLAYCKQLYVPPLFSEDLKHAINLSQLSTRN